MTNTTNLKGRFLDHIGYAPAAGESAAEAFDRLRVENPDLFPVPRATASFWQAIAECVGEPETHKDSQETLIAAIASYLDDQGPSTYSEILRHFRDYWENHEGTSCELLAQPSGRAVDAAVLRALKDGVIEVVEHHDARAREGGAPALYQTVQS